MKTVMRANDVIDDSARAKKTRPDSLSLNLLRMVDHPPCDVAAHRGINPSLERIRWPSSDRV